jgi:opacity protein-like surface antigen
MNKKILAAACGLLVSSGFALAQDDMNFYVGGELGYNRHGYTSEFKDSISNNGGTLKSKNVPTLGLLIGGKFHENFGAEIGYTFFKKSKVDWNTAGWSNDNVKANNMYLDLLGYMPVDTCFDLIGAVGVGRMKIKTVDNNAGNGIGDSSKGKAGFRLGVGAQYKFDDHFAARAMVRYQRANIKDSTDSKLYKSATSINLGLTYTI